MPTHTKFYSNQFKHLGCRELHMWQTDIPKTIFGTDDLNTKLILNCKENRQYFIKCLNHRHVQHSEDSDGAELRISMHLSFVVSRELWKFLECQEKSLTLLGFRHRLY